MTPPQLESASSVFTRHEGPVVVLTNLSARTVVLELPGGSRLTLDESEVATLSVAIDAARLAIAKQKEDGKP